MKILWKHKKKAGTATISDFKRFPIWTTIENDQGGSFEVPIDTTEPLQITDDDLIIYVYCCIHLADSTRMEGIVYLNLVRMREFGLVVIKGDEEFTLSSSQSRKILDEGSPEQFSAWLGKSIEAISPLTYTTPFQFQTGVKIEGKLDLSIW